MFINTLDSIRATEDGILATYERMDLDDKNLRSFFDATETELSSMPRESLRQILPGVSASKHVLCSDNAANDGYRFD